jgi:GNAT superfamily N-acetyltransferase
MATKAFDLPGGIEVERLTDEEFLPLFREWRPRLFSDEVEIAKDRFFSEEEHAALARLAEQRGPFWRLNLVLRDGPSLVGWSTGVQLDAERFNMGNSAVLPEYRRHGLYSALLPPILELLRGEGFQVVTSRHLATNNRVLVPKLRAGFLITGFEISDVFGLLVNLGYFFNPLRREAVLWRVGAVRPSEGLRKILEF